MGWAPGPLGAVEGTWNVVGAVERTEARFRLTGVSLGRAARAWTPSGVGQITARYPPRR